MNQTPPFAEPYVIDRRTPKTPGKRVAIGGAILASLAVIGGGGYYVGKGGIGSSSQVETVQVIMEDGKDPIIKIDRAKRPGETDQQRDLRLIAEVEKKTKEIEAQTVTIRTELERRRVARGNPVQGDTNEEDSTRDGDGIRPTGLPVGRVRR